MSWQISKRDIACTVKRKALEAIRPKYTGKVKVEVKKGAYGPWSGAKYDYMITATGDNWTSTEYYDVGHRIRFDPHRKELR